MEIKCSWVRHKAIPPPPKKKEKKKKNTTNKQSTHKKTNTEVSSHGSCDKIKKPFILTAVIVSKSCIPSPPGRNAL